MCLGVQRLLLWVPLEKQRSQWRQSDRKRIRTPMSRLFICLLPAEVADPATGVFRRVTVEQLFPEAIVRNTDAVIFARDRGEIAYDQDRVFWLPAFSQHRNHACLRVVAVNPFKARRIAVELVKSRFVAESTVQLFNPPLHARMHWKLQYMPFQTHVVSPLAHLPEFVSH